MAVLDLLNRLTGRVVAALQWLALPLIVLLFLQWPLRALFGAYSHEANDLAQVLFALYVAASVTAATRAGTHLAADSVARRYSALTRHRLRQIIAAAALVPWALFVLIAGKYAVISSLQVWERFQETYNPGHFVIKLALWVMALMILAQSALDILRPFRQGER